jgi:hypothetical protein
MIIADYGHQVFQSRDTIGGKCRQLSLQSIVRFRIADSLYDEQIIPNCPDGVDTIKAWRGSG